MNQEQLCLESDNWSPTLLAFRPQRANYGAPRVYKINPRCVDLTFSSMASTVVNSIIYIFEANTAITSNGKLWT